MKNFRKLLFWEALFIGFFLSVWCFVPNNFDVSAVAAVAFAVVVTATTATIVLTVATIIVTLVSSLELRLRFLPVINSIAMEFITIFLLFSFGYWAIAIAGILILFGMRYLPKRLVVRPVAANN